MGKNLPKDIEIKLNSVVFSLLPVLNIDTKKYFIELYGYQITTEALEFPNEFIIDLDLPTPQVINKIDGKVDDLLTVLTDIYLQSSSGKFEFKFGHYIKDLCPSAFITKERLTKLTYKYSQFDSGSLTKETFPFPLTQMLIGNRNLYSEIEEILQFEFTGILFEDAYLSVSSCENPNAYFERYARKDITENFLRRNVSDLQIIFEKKNNKREIDFLSLIFDFNNNQLIFHHLEGLDFSTEMNSIHNFLYKNIKKLCLKYLFLI